MNKVYRSKYEACPYLCETCDDPNNLSCEFGLLIDELASTTGLLRSMLSDETLRKELQFVCKIFYHLSPALREGIAATKDDLEQLEETFLRHKKALDGRKPMIVLPMGCQSASLAHVLRVKCKALVRLIYRHHHLGNDLDSLLVDFANLLSGYFFYLAIALNAQNGVEEIEYERIR